MENGLRRIRTTADYQFGKGVGVRLFPADVEIIHSKATGRIRYVNLHGQRLATYRPTDGLLSISINAANFIAKNLHSARCFVTVRADITEFIAEGGDVFAAHVVRVDKEIRSKDEVIVIDENRNVLAVGRTLLSSLEMKAFKTGVAVKVRHGAKKEKPTVS